jgi:hypothetical protein
MRNCEQVEIIESAYALEVPDVQWQYRLTDMVADRWGGAAASFLYDASGASQLICERVVIRMAGERTVVDAPQSIPVGDPALKHALFETRPHLAQLVDLLGPDLLDSPECQRVLDMVRELHPGPFSVVLRTLDPTHKGLFFALPSRPIGDRMRSMWGQVAVHIGLAYRVRSALANASESVDGSRADAAVVRRALRVGRPPPTELTPCSPGLSTSAIAEHVARLASKLGTTSPVDIVRWLGGPRDTKRVK